MDPDHRTDYRRAGRLFQAKKFERVEGLVVEGAWRRIAALPDGVNLAFKLKTPKA